MKKNIAYHGKRNTVAVDAVEGNITQKRLNALKSDTNRQVEAFFSKHEKKGETITIETKDEEGNIKLVAVDLKAWKKMKKEKNC